MYDLIIIGGGASGLFAAALAEKRGLSTAVIEKNERVGKKLLSTGNGRCNLTNMNVDLTAYNNSFPASALKRYSPESVIDKFMNLGLLTRKEKSLVYPYSLLASSVLDTLRYNISEKAIFTSAKALDIIKNGEAYEIVTDKGVFHGKQAALCSGSAAAGGADSNGLLKKLGHTATYSRPSLLPIPSDAEAIKGLTGIRHRVGASIKCGGRTAYSRGEILFKQNALSGIVSFDLSAALARTKAQKGEVFIDFFPDYSLSEVSSFVESGIFARALHKNIAQLIFKRSKSAAEAAETAKNYRVSVSAPIDFAQAQAVSGGLNTDEFNPITMESKLQKGIYALGEALDVDGLCGGYNLHWAWVSALSAIDAMTKN